jgi:hypothetical protein
MEKGTSEIKNSAYSLLKDRKSQKSQFAGLKRLFDRQSHMSDDEGDDQRENALDEKMEIAEKEMHGESLAASSVSSLYSKITKKSSAHSRSVPFSSPLSFYLVQLPSSLPLFFPCF